MKQILNFWDKICVFCGQQEKSKYDDREQYYECDCDDAVKTRKIISQIEELKQSFPIPKYKITTERVIQKNDNE